MTTVLAISALSVVILIAVVVFAALRVAGEADRRRERSLSEYLARHRV